MTDSTTDSGSGDGAFDVGSSVDELFGDLETGGEWGDERRTAAADDTVTTRQSDTDGVEDQTAAAVFEQLRSDSDDEAGADDLLADESPADIIASADEPDPEPDTPVDDELLADKDELADLLLTGRTKDREFLWVETDDSSDAADTGTIDEPTDADDAGDIDETGEANVETESPTTDTDSDGDRDGAADEYDELVDRLFGDEDDPDLDRAAASEADVDTETDSPSNSSIAVSTRNGEGDATVDADNGPATGGAESGGTIEATDAADGSEPTDKPSSGFVGRLLSIIGGLF
ncbi:hypothetical protein [Natrinema sp. 74]|uniref:hypothetical protein n=1 Tax=Natrinema sp. 74 TaxID=3384159 RepID=UPI0038D4ABBB